MQTKSNQGVSSLATAFGLITCSRLIHYFVDLKSETKNLHTAVIWILYWPRGVALLGLPLGGLAVDLTGELLWVPTSKLQKKTSELAFFRAWCIYLQFQGHLWFGIKNTLFFLPRSNQLCVQPGRHAPPHIRNSPPPLLDSSYSIKMNISNE